MVEPNIALLNYLDKAGPSLLRALHIYDLAVSAEKMMSWQSVGHDNDDWKSGPFLSSGAGEEQIDRSRPYCLMLSLESSVAASLVLGKNAKVEANGGVKFPIPAKKPGEWGAETVIARLTIIEQFELYKKFAQDVSGPFNLKSSKDWSERAASSVLATLCELTDRRNELTHGDFCEKPSMKESVECYNCLRWIASQITETLEKERAVSGTH